MLMLSPLTRALRMGLAVAAILLVAAACSSGDDEAAEPETQASPTEEVATPSAGTEAPSESTDPDSLEIPTVDVETALEDVDTTAPPPEGYCDASTYFASAAFGEEFQEFLNGGAGSEQARANIDQQMMDLVDLAPPDLAEDARLVTAVVTDYVEQVSEAVATDDFVDATALQERFAEVAESGERLAAYDEVVCGNPPPGSDPA